MWDEGGGLMGSPEWSFDRLHAQMDIRGYASGVGVGWEGRGEWGGEHKLVVWGLRGKEEGAGVCQAPVSPVCPTLVQQLCVCVNFLHHHRTTMLPPRILQLLPGGVMWRQSWLEMLPPLPTHSQIDHLVTSLLIVYFVPQTPTSSVRWRNLRHSWAVF